MDWLNCIIGEVRPLIDLLQALLTPVIAGFGIWFAWRQTKTNRSRLKLDLFDRRYELFQSAGMIVSLVIRDGHLYRDDEEHRSALLDFRMSFARNQHLVNTAAQVFFDELETKLIEFETACSQLKQYQTMHNLTDSQEATRVALIDREQEALRYLVASIDRMKAVMADDLKIEH